VFKTLILNASTIVLLEMIDVLFELFQLCSRSRIYSLSEKMRTMNILQTEAVRINK